MCSNLGFTHAQGFLFGHAAAAARISRALHRSGRQPRDEVALEQHEGLLAPAWDWSIRAAREWSVGAAWDRRDRLVHHEEMHGGEWSHLTDRRAVPILSATARLSNCPGATRQRATRVRWGVGARLGTLVAALANRRFSNGARKARGAGRERASASSPSCLSAKSRPDHFSSCPTRNRHTGPVVGAEMDQRQAGGDTKASSTGAMPSRLPAPRPWPGFVDRRPFGLKEGEVAGRQGHALTSS